MQYFYIITYRLSTQDINKTNDGEAERQKRLNAILNILTKHTKENPAYIEDETTSTIFAYSDLNVSSLKAYIEPITIQEDTLTLIQVCRENRCRGKIIGVDIIHPDSIHPSDIQRMI